MIRNFLRASLALIAINGPLVAPAMAQTVKAEAVKPSPAMQKRAQELIVILNGGGDIASSFSPEFLKYISEEKFREIAQGVAAKLGRAMDIAAVTPINANAAAVRVNYEKGVAAMNLAVGEGENGQIAGLMITGVESAEIAKIATLDGVLAAFAQLPGEKALTVSVLGRDGKVIAAAESERALAIGSTFKLVILAELVRSIDAGERSWDDKVAMDGSELPAGAFRQIPAGAEIPLRMLAEAMIRVSDNSATDILIRTLGREKIEAMQAKVGLGNPQANMPFLSTMEAFKLKGVEQGGLGRRYLALDEAGRRAILKDEVAETPGSAIGALFADGKPVMIDRIEWFASPADLARVMDWFREHGDTSAGAEALRILALNPGPLASIKDRFQYIGYKGGSEPGVISMTVLTQDKAGVWRVVSASWNNPHASVDELQFGGLVRRAAELSLE